MELLKTDIKKFKDFEKRYNEIRLASENKTERENLFDKLERESGIRVAVYHIVSNEIAKLQKKLSHKKISVTDNEENLTKASDKNFSPADYDKLFLNSNTPKKEREAGSLFDLNAKIYSADKALEYIKEFKAHSNKIAEYEQKFKEHYLPNGLPHQKINTNDFKKQVGDLQKAYKISVSEFLGVKHKQPTKQIEAIKNIKDNNLTKTSSPRNKN